MLTHSGDTSLHALEASDVSQELAKKKQKEGTRARDEACQALQEAARKVRNAAKSVLIGRPGVPVEFESTVRAKSAKGKGKSRLKLDKSVGSRPSASAG
jgi:hypothetical protein